MPIIEFIARGSFETSRRLLAVAVCLIATAVGVCAQTSVTDGATPAGYTAGAPAGSHPLSGFDTINFFNGNLNFSLPLLQLKGRGGSGHSFNLKIERKWRKMKITNAPYASGSGGWQIIQAGYGAGALEGRIAGMQDMCDGGWGASTLLRLTFTAPDGTEYELRDVLTGGAPGWTEYDESCVLQTSPSRGKVFITADGNSATFISDVPVTDGNGYGVNPTGYLLLRNGTRFRISMGKVTQMRDRNGNLTTYTYSNGLLSSVVDSLGRSVTISYHSYGSGYDSIAYKGSGDSPRTIRVWYTTLGTTGALRSGYSLQTYRNLFPELSGTSTTNYFNPEVVSALELPDGRSYSFQYNSYGELSRVVLPTGGAVEYDWQGGLSGGTASGVMLNGDANIYRRLVEKRIYDNGGSGSSYTSRMTVSKPEDASSNNLGYVVVEQRNSSGTLLTKEIHYYHGSSRLSFLQAELDYGKWKEGREWKAEFFANNGTTVLRRVEHTWQQPTATTTWPLTAAETNDNARPNDPQITQTVTTLVDTNQVSKQTFAYDKYCNKTDVYEYDYGSGSPPASWVRRSHTDYLTTNSVNGNAYDTVNPSTNSPDLISTIHLRNLATQTQVFDAGGYEKSRATFEYDNYVNDSLHAPLDPCSLIFGLCDGTTPACPNNPNFTSTGHTIRGNVTRSTNWILSTNTPLHSYPQYDVAGNVTKMIDPRQYATDFDFNDNFGAPDGEAQTNTAPSPLGGLKSYGFAKMVTNALGHVIYTQFDYYTGRAVDFKDANGIVSSGYSVGDFLDRPTKVIRAVNTSAQNQTLFLYDDLAKTITTKSDLNTSTDQSLVSVLVYDNLGRTIQSRLYEGGSNYIVTEQQYDTLGRAFKISNPYRPLQGESAVWTETAFDALGRETTVTTPDSAVGTTSYSGNTVTVTDQAGKKRRNVTDALGRLIRVDEPDANNNLDSWGVPIQPTNYSYDVLDDLTTVTQGAQTRTFIYDSLKRLRSATNPESGGVTYDYDNNGNLTQKTDARVTAVTTTLVYDAINRVTSKSYNDNPQTPPVSYFYDSQQPLPSGAPSFDRGWSTGRLVAVTYGSGSSAGTYRGYDQLGRVVRQYQRTDSVNYLVEATYWASSAIKDETYPAVPGAGDRRMVSYTNDAAGRLASLNSTATSYAPAASVSSIGYASHNALKTETYGNSLVHAVSYNNRLQPIEIKLGTSGNPTSILSLTYNYGTTTNNGNVQSLSYNGGGLSYIQSFGYDQLNRLATSNENSGAGWSQTNGYDRYGNRWIDLGGGSQSLYFNTSNNRISGWSYDGAGNLLNDGYHTYAYDAENKVSKVDAASAYIYDGEGQRVRQLIGDNLRFVYGTGGQIIAEFDGSTGALKKEYVYGESGLAATVEPTAVNANGTRYTTSDNLGTPRVVTNSSAAVVSRHDYKPFGEELGSGIGGRTTGMGFVVNDGIRQKFTSKERDNETGLDYFGARYFAGAQGRFTSPDPLMASGRSSMPQSWNRYGYVLNNPLKLIDPTGLIDDDPQEKPAQSPDQSKEPKVTITNPPAGVSGPNVTATVTKTAAYDNVESIPGPSGDPMKTDDGKTATYGFEAKLEYTVNNVEGVKVESATETVTTTVNGKQVDPEPPTNTPVVNGKFPDTIGVYLDKPVPGGATIVHTQTISIKTSFIDDSGEKFEVTTVIRQNKITIDTSARTIRIEDVTKYPKD